MYVNCNWKKNFFKDPAQQSVQETGFADVDFVKTLHLPRSTQALTVHCATAT